MSDAREGPAFRLIEHTGDIGFEVTGTSAADLFGRAAETLSLLIADVSSVEESDRRQIEAEGHDLEELLVAFLGEVLFLHDTEGFLVRRAAVLAGPARKVKADLFGEEYDPGRHAILREIKAVTYHGIRVRESAGVWEARVILDI
jgi:SHS2 domain-containing protein